MTTSLSLQMTPVMQLWFYDREKLDILQKFGWDRIDVARDLMPQERSMSQNEFPSTASLVGWRVLTIVVGDV